MKSEIKSAYFRLASLYLGGFVPVHMLRREANLGRRDFDQAVIALADRVDPAIELHAGDRQNLTAEQVEDSLIFNGKIRTILSWR